MHAEGVPRHDVGVVDGTIGRGPGRKAVAAVALGGVVAGRVELVGLVRREPERSDESLLDQDDYPQKRAGFTN